MRLAVGRVAQARPRGRWQACNVRKVVGIVSDEQQKEQAEPVFYDALFRQKRKKGQWRVVNAPRLEGAVADTHAHLHMLPDPALALGRCAIHGVSFVCEIVDVHEDGALPFRELDSWLLQAEIHMRRLAKGRC